MRDLILDFKRGGASVPEVVHGIVRIWGTEVRPNGPSVVVTTETTLKLSNGKATLANAQTSGTGPLYEWAYIIQVEPFHGRNYRFYVAIPDGTGPVNLVDLPKLNPITGEGFYLDIEEWEALYGALPSRVDALETSQSVQDGKIANLESGELRGTGSPLGVVAAPPGTYYTDTVGTTGAWRWLKASGTGTTGWEVATGDTKWRNIAGLLADGWASLAGGGAFIRRVDGVVELRLELLDGSAATTNIPLEFPSGFSPNNTTRYRLRGSVSLGSGVSVSLRRYYTQNNTLTIDSGAGQSGMSLALTFIPADQWPTTLPGIPE